MKYVNLAVELGESPYNYGYSDWFQDLQDGDVVKIKGSHIYDHDIIITANIELILDELTSYNTRSLEPAGLLCNYYAVDLSTCIINGLKIYADTLKIGEASNCYIETDTSCLITNNANSNPVKNCTIVSKSFYYGITVNNASLEYCIIYSNTVIQNNNSSFKYIKTNLDIDNMFGRLNDEDSIEDIETIPLKIPTITDDKIWFNMGCLDDSYFQFWSRSQNYYVDLNSTSTSPTEGTQSDPFSYTYLHMWFYDQGVQNNDNFYVKGIKTSEFFEASFLNIGELEDDTVLNFYGWLDENDSPPIIIAGNDVSSFMTANIGSYTLDANFKDFVFQFENFEFDSLGSTEYTLNTIFKNCAIIVENYTQEYGVNIGGSASYYGCTIDAENYLNDCPTINMYDSVIHITTPTLLDHLENLNTNENITSVVDFEDYIPTVPIYDPPVFNSELLRIRYADGNTAEFYQNKDDLNYLLYNIPNGGESYAFRVLNGYNNGFYNTVRLSYGAFTFEAVTTYGHIGAFNFNKYSTIIVPNLAILKFSAISNGISNSLIKFKPAVLKFSAISNNTILQELFGFDFTGTPRQGSSPLQVHFQAYNYIPLGAFANQWEAKEFHWYVDFANFPSTYVTTLVDNYDHVYCGTENQEYDVKLCIVYGLITTPITEYWIKLWFIDFPSDKLSITPGTDFKVAKDTDASFTITPIETAVIDGSLNIYDDGVLVETYTSAELENEITFKIENIQKNHVVRFDYLA